MTHFLRSNLLGTYNWLSNERIETNSRADPKHILLDRQNGHEVLSLIKEIMQLQKLTSIEQGQEIEMMIKVAPTHLHTRQQVVKWIKEN